MKCSSHIETDRNSQGELGTKEGKNTMVTSQLNSIPDGVINQLPEGYELVRSLLGDDLISPEEVANTYSVSYTDKQLKHFAKTLPDEKMLQWFRTHDYILVAGMPTKMNLFQVRELGNGSFGTRTAEWHVSTNLKFARGDVVKAGQWLAIRKEAVPNSFDKTWSEQRDLLNRAEYVPNAPEVNYVGIIYCKIRGVHLLRGKYVRTSSISPYSCHVLVGYLGGSHIGIDDYWDYHRYDFIGISSARKLTLNT